MVLAAQGSGVEIKKLKQLPGAVLGPVMVFLHDPALAGPWLPTQILLEFALLPSLLLHVIHSLADFWLLDLSPAHQLPALTWVSEVLHYIT